MRTFGDLRIPAADDLLSGLPAGKDFRLVVTVSDLSRRRLVRLPWDLPTYGVDPDEYPVARAVRRRLVWLGINLGTAFLASSVVGQFEGTIEKIVVVIQ